MNEPQIKVGIMAEERIDFKFDGQYKNTSNNTIFEGELFAEIDSDNVIVIFQNDDVVASGTEIVFAPINADKASFMLKNVTIGIDFHWEQKENQQFPANLKLIVDKDKIHAINEVPLERYLTSVISSEMKATASLNLLKAHAVISRSWLIAQIVKQQQMAQSAHQYSFTTTEHEWIKWYDREDHTLFDVCADDHCQRYQGIQKSDKPNVAQAIAETYGTVIKYGDEICDARYSKSCGGVAEAYESVWEPKKHPYLTKIIDNPKPPTGFDLELTNELAAQKWIEASPESFCNTTDEKVLTQVLNDYDVESKDFYRWRVEYTQDEISNLILKKSGIDFGKIIALIPIERGESGRLIKLKIEGTKRTKIIGKELEIRKILSKSHLYSSAFVVETEVGADGLAQKFILKGAGWGHGVGLCQIGAAVMGEKGYDFKEILLHYFKDVQIVKEY